MSEAILDNVVDLGELVLQFYALYVERPVHSAGTAMLFLDSMAVSAPLNHLEL